MKTRLHLVVVGCLLGLAAVAAGGGLAVGYRLGRQDVLRRADPESWHERSARQFEALVHPTPEQSQRVSVHLDAARQELRGIRRDAIERSAAVIDRLVQRVEQELTPAQRTAFEAMKPKRGEVDLEVLTSERP